MNGKAMQRFMGAANFHREFSHEFAKIAAPLEQARTVSGKIHWTPEMDKAFEIERAFQQEFITPTCGLEEDLYLTTDASLIGIGAWLGQKDAYGEIMPIICVSKKLTPTQQRWSATKRELWGLMWAMQKFRHYLLGRWFIARVDHRHWFTC